MSRINNLDVFKQLQENSVEVVKISLIEQALQYNGSGKVPPSIQDLGQRDYPIKASVVSDLMGCHKRFIARAIEDSADYDSEAIQKGNITGGYVYLALQEIPEEYIVSALKKKATLLSDKVFQNNLQRARNLVKYLESGALGKVRKDLMEVRMTVQLGSRRYWHTGAMDLVVERDGVLYVYDIKCSGRDVKTLFYKHCYQLLSYSLIASKYLGVEVKIGGIIRVNSFVSAEDKPIQALAVCEGNCQTTIEDIHNALDIIKMEDIRGCVQTSISETCTYCKSDCFLEVNAIHQNQLVIPEVIPEVIPDPVMECYNEEILPSLDTLAADTLVQEKEREEKSDPVGTDRETEKVTSNLNKVGHILDEIIDEASKIEVKTTALEETLKNITFSPDFSGVDWS